MSDPVLCYVEDNWAYFTTQKLENQWGDDWDDAPYEHNAGEPYYYLKLLDEKNNVEPWEIIRIAWDGVFDRPCDDYNNSPYSVNQINCGEVPWLRSVASDDHIYAGTTLSQFCELVRKAGGSIYMEVK